MIEKNRQSRRGVATKYLAFGTAAALTLTGVALGMTASSADTQTPPTGEVSAAHGHGLYLDVLGLDLAGTASAHSAAAQGGGWSDEQVAQLQANLLGLDVEVGTVTLPLLQDPENPGAGGLLSLGTLSTLVGTASSPGDTNSVASSGLLGSGGSAVNLDPSSVDSTFEPATLDVSALLEQVLGQSVRNSLLDTAKFEIGAIGAKAEKADGAVTSQYMLAGLSAEVHSPLVGGLVDTVHDTVDELVTPINDLVGPSGELTTTLADVVGLVDELPLVTATVDEAAIDLSGLVTEINNELLGEPLQNADGSITINLSNGLVTLDLAKLIVENHPTATSLNDLPANTNALSGAVVTAILDGVSDLLIGSEPDSLVSKVVAIVTEGVYSAAVKLSLNVELGLDPGITSPLTVAQGPIVITSTVGALVGAAGYDPDDFNIDVSGIAVLPGLPCIGLPPVQVCVSDLVNLGALLQPVVDLLEDEVAGLGAAVLTPVIDNVVVGLQDGLVDGLSSVITPLLDDALDPLLSEVLALTINEQPTAAPTNAAGGDLGAGSFTVRALSLALLPSIPADLVKIELASATVVAADPAAAIVATPDSVASGETVTVAGSFFTPSSPVSITIPGVATPITTTTGASGAFSATWTVPAGFATGPVLITATDGGGKVATDTVTVVEPTLTADDAPQGGAVALSGTGFVPGESVTITSDLPGAPTAQPTAAVDGSITASWPVLATQAPDTYTFTATGAGGREAEDDAAVTLAVATLTASPNPVLPGGTVTLTGGNFAPGENITVTLPVSCVPLSGLPATADVNGAFVVTCQVDSGVADGTALNFAAAGNDSGRSATAQTEVDSQPAADVNTNASASAAASAQANGNNEVAAQAAALAAAMADHSTAADAAADPDAEAAAAAAARANVSAGASTNASATATSTSNASAQASAQASADSTANANADATASASAAGTADMRAASQAASDAAADGVDASATASQDATANVRANANASASASASARANGDEEAAAQAAAQAAAYSAADSDASAAANVDATAAADAAAYTDPDSGASANASANVTASANVAAQAAAQASSTASIAAQASADHNADSAADGTFDARSAARSAAEASSAANAHTAGSADAAVDAAANVQANANASASASASADADSHSNPNAQAAAQAAAFANNDSDANAAATPNAVAAAQAAARPNVDATASTTASQNAESQAVAAAQSTADATSVQAANASATATADAEASAAAAAISSASTDASQNAAADVNASASASASAQADSKANAAAQAAAETSALANASTTATASASAAATANAVAAAQAAAQTAARTNVTAVASANASQETSAQANVAANAAAQATATTSATANTAASADTQAAATANSSAAAQAAANQAAFADSTADASASAAANARASANASPSAQAAAQGVANASGGQKLVNTGTAIGGITAAAVLLLLIGSIVLVSAQRRKNLV